MVLIVLPDCLLLLLLVDLGVLVMVMRNWVRNWKLSGSVQPTTPVVAVVRWGPPISLAGASTRGAAAVCARKHRNKVTDIIIRAREPGHHHPTPDMHLSNQDTPKTSLTRKPSPIPLTSL